MQTALAQRLARELDWFPHEYFFADDVPPEVMDILWEQGWRHFGTMFFRTAVDEIAGTTLAITPLRVDVQAFLPSKSQRRVLRRGEVARLRVVVGGVAITKDIEAMFHRHAERFSENKPDSLYSYFADDKASMPCKALQCSVYQDAQLLAVSFFDVGATALSSVYAMFEPDAHLYSLGTYTMLCELDFARRTGKQYLYSGYAHEAASHLHSLYGYKKHFSPSEAYAWLDDWSLLE